MPCAWVSQYRYISTCYVAIICVFRAFVKFERKSLEWFSNLGNFSYIVPEVQKVCVSKFNQSIRKSSVLFRNIVVKIAQWFPHLPVIPDSPACALFHTCPCSLPRVCWQYREERFRQTSESTNQRVLWWSIAQTGILLVTGFWQMRHLKSFFEAKKLV